MIIKYTSDFETKCTKMVNALITGEYPLNPITDRIMAESIKLYHDIDITEYRVSMLRKSLGKDCSVLRKLHEKKRYLGGN